MKIINAKLEYNPVTFEPGLKILIEMGIPLSLKEDMHGAYPLNMESELAEIYGTELVKLIKEHKYER